MEQLFDGVCPAVGGSRLISQLLVDKSEPIPEAGCWIWTGGQRGSRYIKYGHQSFQGRGYVAHRLSYLIFKGAIPAGMSVCHKCDTPLCINPGHLWLGTNKENCDDKVSKGRHYRGGRHWCAKLTPEQVIEIRQSPLGSSELGRIYGVSPTQIGVSHGK